MPYFIMSQNALEGFQTGVFIRLNGLYFKSVETEETEFGPTTRVKWCNNISEAQPFMNEQTAWAEAYRIWGMGFARTTFMVVRANEDLINVSAMKAPRYQAR